MARIEPVTLQHKIGSCPNCRAGLWAELDVAVEVGTPMVSNDGKAVVHARPVFTGMRLEHTCARDGDGALVIA